MTESAAPATIVHSIGVDGVDIDAIASRVYGKPFSTLRAFQVSETGSDILRLTETMDYDQELENFDEPSAFVGFGLNGEPVRLEGVTQLDYWLSIGWVGRNGKTEATVGRFPSATANLTGAVFPEEDSARRFGVPPLVGVLADLIRRGEIPRGDYSFHGGSTW